MKILPARIETKHCGVDCGCTNQSECQFKEYNIRATTDKYITALEGLKKPALDKHVVDNLLPHKETYNNALDEAIKTVREL